MEEDIRTGLGMVHVITGDGKGKTTSALGMSLRGVGRGLRVCIVQFMKGYDYGEIIAAGTIENLDIKQFGRAEFVNKNMPENVDVQEAVNALKYARDVLQSGKYDILILDEVNVAIDFNLIELDSVIELVKERPENMELVLTGRNAPKELIEVADYVSEVREVKHPFQKGVQARKGIEF
jgi:cob(I)alamin adenosyltransferase